MGKFWSKWKNLFLLAGLLALLVYGYTYFNGGSTESNLMQFLKTDALKALIIVVTVSIGVVVFKKMFKTNIRH